MTALLCPPRDMPMPRRKADGEKTPTVNIRVRVKMKKDLDDVAKAYGWPVWKLLEHLLTAILPAELDAAQPKLKKIRKNQAEIEEAQKALRKERGGE